MLHVVAEGNVYVAAVELAGQAAAVERWDGVGAAPGEETDLSVTANGRGWRGSGSLKRSPSSTCTSGAAWGRPRCLKSICKNIRPSVSASRKDPEGSFGVDVHAGCLT